MSMKSLFSLNSFPKAVRVIKGDDTQFFLAKQPLGSHKEKMILSLTNTDTTAALLSMATAYLPLGNKTSIPPSALLRDGLRGPTKCYCLTG